MRRLGWYAVSATVAVIILGSVLLLAANLYVQSPTVQQRIRHALASALRMPVSIRKTTVTPWEGLRIDGITVHSDDAMPARDKDQATDFLTAESFRVHFALWPLLHRQFVVTLLWLDKPRLVWAQNAEGRWQFPPGPDAGRHRRKAPREDRPVTPAPEAALPPVTPGEISSSPASSPATTATVAPSPAPVAAAGELLPRRTDGFTIALDRFRLRHGNLDFLSAKRRPIGQFEEVNLDGRLSDASHAAGILWFENARLSRAGLMLTQFHSNFAYDRAGGLSVNDGKAAFAGGSVTADYHMATDEPGSPFSGEFRVSNVDLKELLQQAGNHLPFIEGRLQGKAVASGLLDQKDSRKATGRFELIDARLKDFPLFQLLGDAMRIPDLSHMQFKTARFDCRLDGATLEVDPLLLISNDLKITAQGHYATDEDRLDLHARLIIDEAVSRQLPDFIGEQFKPCDDEAPGSRFVDFDVTGPLNNPKSNLYNRLLGDPMTDFLHNFLSPRPKIPKDKPTRRHADTPGASPADGGENGQ